MRQSAVPLYNVADAARFIRIDTERLRRWFEGYEVAGKRHPAILAPPPERPFGFLALSFENLIEAATLSIFRSQGISQQKIRLAHDLAVEEFGEHPFARNDVFYSGQDIFMRADDESAAKDRPFITLTRSGQRSWAEVIQVYLRRVEWRDKWPVAWYPKTRPVEDGVKVVRLDPRVAYGLPTVRGVRTDVVFGRFEAGESIRFLCKDFRVSVEEIEEAVRWEASLRRAA